MQGSRARALVVLLVLAGCGGGSSSGGSFTPGSTTAPTTSSSPTPSSRTTTSPSAPVATSTTAQPGGSFRMLTYNVAGLPQGISSSNPQVNTPQISPKLNGYDLVVTQEDFAYQSDLAKDALHPFRSTPLAQHTTVLGDGLSVFSRIAFTDFRRFQWATCHGVFSNKNDCLAAKGFAVARFELEPGTFVDIYDVHGDAGGDSGDIDARRAQFAQLASFIATYSVDRAVIVAGDTNLKDSRPGDVQTLGTLLAACGLADAGRQLGAPDRIDRFLYRSATNVKLTPSNWALANEFVTASGAPLSDHEAVRIDFAWSK